MAKVSIGNDSIRFELVFWRLKCQRDSAFCRKSDFFWSLNSMKRIKIIRTNGKHSVPSVENLKAIFFFVKFHFFSKISILMLCRCKRRSSSSVDKDAIFQINLSLMIIRYFGASHFIRRSSLLDWFIQINQMKSYSFKSYSLTDSFVWFIAIALKCMEFEMVLSFSEIGSIVQSSRSPQIQFPNEALKLTFAQLQLFTDGLLFSFHFFFAEQDLFELIRATEQSSIDGIFRVDC